MSTETFRWLTIYPVNATLSLAVLVGAALWFTNPVAETRKGLLFERLCFVGALGLVVPWVIGMWVIGFQVTAP